jgi:hypothetical protein
MQGTTQYFVNGFFIKKSLRFHRPFKFYARHLGIKIAGPYSLNYIKIKVGLLDPDPEHRHLL